MRKYLRIRKVWVTFSLFLHKSVAAQVWKAMLSWFRCCMFSAPLYNTAHFLRDKSALIIPRPCHRVSPIVPTGPKLLSGPGEDVSSCLQIANGLKMVKWQQQGWGFFACFFQNERKRTRREKWGFLPFPPAIIYSKTKWKFLIQPGAAPTFWTY